MYILVATNHDTNKVDISTHISMKNAFNNKRIKEDRGEVTMVFNKCLPSGTQPIIDLMKAHMFYSLSFEKLLNLYDDIEKIEKGIM